MKKNKQILIIQIFVCLLIHQCKISLSEIAETNKNPKIIIIGAGPAGIAAASKLFENNITNVTILEAENRIGGRVFTTKLGNYLVDLGGQWVHGVKGNVVYELANPYGVLENPDESHKEIKTSHIDSLGNFLSDEIEKKYSNFYDKYVEGAWYGSDKNYLSSGQYIEKMFHEEFENDTVMINDKRKFLDILELSITGMDPAESWYNVSTASLFKELEGNTLVNWKEHGYSMILDILMKRYPNPENELPVLNNTILNSEVKSIDYSKKDNEILITLTNGKSYNADHVMVTVSLGVLKENHDTLFIPKLAEDKIKVIQTSGFGNVAKIFLLFYEPFWQSESSNFIYYNFFWNEGERKLIEANPEKVWLLGMTGLFNVEHKPNLLELWISGKYARLMEALPEEKVFDHTVENLHKFLGKKYNVTEPIAMLRTKWFSNPHFRGTYSYRSVEAQINNFDADDLEGPIVPKDLRILLAGEATSKFRYGTVDGAISSGWKAAERLINYYKNVSTNHK